MSDIFDTITIPRPDIFHNISEKDIIIAKQKAKILGPPKEEPNILAPKPGETYFPGLAAPDQGGLIEPGEPYKPKQVEPISEVLLDATASGWANVISAGSRIGAALLERPVEPIGVGGMPKMKSPEQMKADIELSKQMKKDAQFMWQVAQNPELVTDRTDPMAKFVSMAGQTLPYITATTIGYGLGGGFGAFMVGSAVEGNSAYQTAMDYFRTQSPTGEVTPEQEEKAELIGIGVGIISGAIEAYGGNLAEGFLTKASERISNKLLQRGAQFSIGALIEGLEETGQEFAALTGEEFYRDIDWKEYVERGKSAFAGGVSLGGVFKSGSASMHWAVSRAGGDTAQEYMKNLNTLIEERNQVVKEIAKTEGVDEDQAVQILDERVKAHMALEIKPDVREVAENLGISEEMAADIMNMTPDELLARQEGQPITQQPVEVLPEPPEPSEGQTAEDEGKSTKEGEIVAPVEEKPTPEPLQEKPEALRQAEDEYGLTIEELEEMLPLTEGAKRRLVESGEYTEDQVSQLEQEYLDKLEEMRNILLHEQAAEIEKYTQEDLDELGIRLNLDELKAMAKQLATDPKAFESQYRQLGYTPEEIEFEKRALREDIERLEAKVAAPATVESVTKMMDAEVKAGRATESMKKAAVQAQQAAETQGVEIVWDIDLTKQEYLDTNDPEHRTAIMEMEGYKTEQELNNAIAKGIKWISAGSETEVSYDQATGKRRSHIKIRKGADASDIFHETVHAIQRQTGEFDIPGTREEQARDIARRMVEGEKINFKAIPRHPDIMGPPGTSYSARTIDIWLPAYEKAALDAGFTKTQIKKQVIALREAAAIVLQHEQYLPYDPDSPIKLLKRKPIRPNVAYLLSADLDTICPKNIQYNANVAEIEKRLGRYLHGNEAAQLALYMKNMGQMSPCLYCYVEAKRRDLKTQLANHLVFRDKIFKEADKAKKADINHLKKFMYGYNAKKNILTSGSTKQLNKWIEEWNADKKAGRKHVTLDQRKLIKAKPGTPEAQVFHDAYRYAASATGANLEDGYAEYGGQYHMLSEQELKDAGLHGGHRGFSLSDFKVDHAIDIMQIVHDYMALQLKSHYYTKQPEFVRIFGKTGIKVNMSTAAVGDTVDTLKPDRTWGIDWDTAKKLSKNNPDAGVMFMAANDAQFKWALEQDWIGLIIPFHKSGMPKAEYATQGWKDYTRHQTEVPIDKNKPHPSGAKSILPYPHVTKKGVKIPGHNNNKARYLQLCKKYGLVPKFANLILADGTKVIDHPGYMKLVVEFAKWKTPQKIVDATKIDYKAFEEIFRGWVQQEGYTREQKFDEGTVRSFMGFYAGQDRSFGEFPPEVSAFKELMGEAHSVKRVEENIKKKYGTTEYITKAGFLNPDGTFTQFPQVLTHETIVENAGGKLEEYLGSGGIRVNNIQDNISLEIFQPLTPRQTRALSDMFIKKSEAYQRYTIDLDRIRLQSREGFQTFRISMYPGFEKTAAKQVNAFSRGRMFGPMYSIKRILPEDQTDTPNTAKVTQNVTEAIETDYTKSTAAKREKVADDRQAMGLDEINSPERKKWEESLRNAKNKNYDRNANIIAGDVVSNPRSLNDEETAGLVIRLAELKSEHKKLMNRVKDTTDYAEIQSTSALVSKIEDEFDLISKAVTLSGTEKGRALAAQKLTINEDYDLISVKNRAKTAAGRNLKPAEEAKLKSMVDKIESNEKRIAELEQYVKELTASRQLVTRSRFKSMSKTSKDMELTNSAQKLKELLAQGCEL